MIASNYNYTVKYNNRIIYFNGISDKVFSVSFEEYELIEKIMSNKKLQNDYPKLTNWLIRNSFLVQSHADELQTIININCKIRQNASDYYLMINPTMNCNFHCWYCFEEHTKGGMSDEVIQAIKMHLKLKLKSYTSLRIEWFGGEPLLYFNSCVYPLSRYAKAMCKEQSVNFINSMTTNGSLINKNMIKALNEIDLCRFQITLDGDKETHNRIRNQHGVPSFDKIINNIVLLCESVSNAKILLRINYTNESIKIPYNQVLSVIPTTLRPHVNVQFHRVWQTYLDSDPSITNDYLTKHRQEIHEMGFSIPYKRLSLYKGCSCYANRQDYANINYDGRVYRCSARNYTQENSLGILDNTGKIIWDKEQLGDIDSQPFFGNADCLDCTWLPICGGPCFQHAFEARMLKQTYVCRKKI